MSLAHVNDHHTPALPAQGRFDEGQLDVLRRTIAADLTEDEFALFGQVCQRTGLDPFARQIWAIKRRAKKRVNKNGRWEDVWEEHLTIQTGIDGYRLIAERSGRYRGQTEPEWCGPDGRWVDIWLSAEPPAAARVGVLRDDFATPVMGIAMFDEFAATTGQGDDKKLTGQWRTMPAHMIAKCAEALAIRKAFPNDVYGICTVEEMGQADNGGAIEAAAREHRGIPAEQFREIVAAAETLTPGQLAELQAWRDAEGLTIKPQDLTQDDARRVMDRILELGRGGGGGDGPEGSAAAPPPPENEDPTQKGGGDDDSTGKGSPGPTAAAAAPGKSSSEVESEPPPTRQGDGEASASPSPSGITAEQLRQAVHAKHPDRDTTRKQEITAAKIAAQVAGALSIRFAGSFDDVIADQDLAAAVLADLRGDDTPPPPSGGGQGSAVGEQPPAQAPDSGPAPADPAPTAEPVPLKTQNASDWRKENARCQALAAEHLSGDPDTLKSQREALAYQASGGRVTSWSEVTRGEFSQIRTWLEFIANGHGRLVGSSVPEHFGWHVQVEEAA